MRKGMIKNFLPDYRFKKITDIRPDFFEGSELVIFDLDNTLVFSETAQTTKEIKEWFGGFQKAYKCVIVSNSSTFSKRSREVFQNFNCDVFLSRYKKPSKKLFEELKEKYKFENDRVFIVGDRVFADILFGNINGAKTVLVEPLSGKENTMIKILRELEKAVLLVLGFLGYN